MVRQCYYAIIFRVISARKSLLCGVHACGTRPESDPKGGPAEAVPVGPKGLRASRATQKANFDAEITEKALVTALSKEALITS